MIGKVGQSTVKFEYDEHTEHAQLIDLLRRALKQTDLEALLKLKKIIVDIRGT